MKRFYDAVSVAESSDESARGWQVMLDDRGLKTVGGTPQVVPSKALAEKMAREWAEQGEDIDTSRFKMRDLADYAIEQVQLAPQEAIAKLVGFAETDTLCYRADPEDALFNRQQEVWEPILQGLEQREGVTLVRVSGIIHRQQNAEAINTLRAKLAQLDPFSIAGLELLASLSASLTIALAVNEAGSDPEQLWRAASLEEEWQADLWGRDSLAEERRAARRADFLNAAEWLELLSEG